MRLFFDERWCKILEYIVSKEASNTAVDEILLVKAVLGYAEARSGAKLRSALA